MARTHEEIPSKMVRPLILMVDDDLPAAKIRRYILEISGYQVAHAETPEVACSNLNQKPDALLLNLRPASLENFRILRKSAPGIPAIGLVDSPFSSRPTHLADAFAVKIDGPKALLQQLDELLHFQHHTHAELEGECVVFVDATRRYVEATQKACELIGYRRGELLGKRIEDVSEKDSAAVQAQFESYVQAGQQDGLFVLKHKDGRQVPVLYKALVLPDGCMAARWEPIQDRRAS